MSTPSSASTAPISLLDRTEPNADALRRVALPHGIVAAAAVFVVVTVVVGLLVNWIVGLIAGLVLAGGAAVLTMTKVPESSRGKVEAVLVSRDATEAEFPRYHNLMEGLTLNFGVQRPALRVLDSDALNLAVYGPADDGVVVATSGLLNTLERIELEGVLAAALVRLRSNDADLGMQIAALRSFGLLPLTMDSPDLAAKQRSAVSLAGVIDAQLGTQRGFLGDLGAIDLTRYPPGLGAALIKMEQHGAAVSSATLGTAHLWIVDPLGPAEGASAQTAETLRGDAPISQRIMLMEEL